MDLNDLEADVQADGGYRQALPLPANYLTSSGWATSQFTNSSAVVFYEQMAHYCARFFHLHNDASDKLGRIATAAERLATAAESIDRKLGNPRQ